MKVCGQEIRVEGKLIRIARLASEGYGFLQDPERAIDALRNSGSRIDLFTFLQKLPDTAPKYDHVFEWDNLAALRVSTCEHWLTKQINPKARNKVRRAEKNGLIVREVPFDDALV